MHLVHPHDWHEDCVLVLPHQYAGIGRSHVAGGVKLAIKREPGSEMYMVDWIGAHDIDKPVRSNVTLPQTKEGQSGGERESRTDWAGHFFYFFLVIERVPLNHLVRAILAVAQPGDRGEALHAGLEGAVDGEVALVGLDGVPLGLPERSVPGRNKRPRPSISQRCHRGSRMRGAFSYKDGAVGEAMWSAQYARGAQWSELCFMYCAMFQ